MTVAELRALLDTLPDDGEVYYCDGEDGIVQVSKVETVTGMVLVQIGNYRQLEGGSSPSRHPVVKSNVCGVCLQ